MGTILLDVDGVCADFTGMVRTFCAGAGYEMPTPTEWDFLKALPTDHHATDAGGFKVNVRQHVDVFLQKAVAWEKMRAIDGAIHAVEAFRRDSHRVVFVTSPWESCREWANVRRVWLRNHFKADAVDVVVCKDKSLVRGDVFVDDKPENVGAWGQVNAYRAFIWDAPYNQGWAVIPRLTGGWTQDNVNRVLEAAAR